MLLFLCVIVSQLKERRPRKTWKSRRWSSKKDEKEIADALQFAQRNRESWQTEVELLAQWHTGQNVTFLILTRLMYHVAMVMMMIIQVYGNRRVSSQ